MKTKKLFPAALLGLFALAAVSCNKNDDYNDTAGEPLALIEVAADGTTRALENNICPVLEVTDPLTADEIEFLYAMREDEKLSKDIYSAFAALYPASPQFSKIASAEATHIAAVERILTYYEIDFPALGEAGVFADPERQARYDELTAQGTTVLEAFTVMAWIEEENVVVYKAVEANIGNPNIKLIVSNMIRSSSNHLKAAVRRITALGGSYTPSFIEQDEFDGIIDSGFSQGNRYGQQQGKNGNKGNTNSAKGSQGQGNKGSVNNNGICTGTCTGSFPGTCDGTGQAGKGYRGGRA